MLTHLFEPYPDGCQDAAKEKKPQHPLITPLAFLTLPYTLADLLLEPRPIIPPLYRRIQIRRTLVIGIRQHGNDRHEDLFHAKDGSPPLRGRLVKVVRIVPRFVQDGDANLPILVNIRMPHFALERHFRRPIWEVFGEDEAGLEEASLEEGAVGSHDEDFPIVNVAVVYESYGNEINWILGQL